MHGLIERTVIQYSFDTLQVSFFGLPCIYSVFPINLLCAAFTLQSFGLPIIIVLALVKNAFLCKKRYPSKSTVSVGNHVVLTTQFIRSTIHQLRFGCKRKSPDDFAFSFGPQMDSFCQT